MLLFQRIAVASLFLVGAVISASPVPVLSEQAKLLPVSMEGIWQGEYAYPAGMDMAPVKFQVIVTQNGNKIAGFMKEPNTFGAQGEPWLHAVLKGKVGEDGQVSFTKTYDGSAGQSHDVKYEGQLSRDGKKLQGTWDVNGFEGTFSLERVILDERALENLK